MYHEKSNCNGLWMDIIAMLVGTMILVLSLIYHYGDEQSKILIKQMIPFLVVGGFFIIGICGAFMTYIKQKRSSKKYNKPVDGVCIEHKTHLGSGGTVLKCPVYQITLNNDIFRLEKETYSNVNVPQIGENRTLYIDENNLESYVEPIADKSSRLIVYFISVSFMVMGIITLVLSFI